MKSYDYVKWFLIANLFFLSGCGARTPKIKNVSGGVVASSVASLEEVKIGGVNQFILVRGENVANPILLFLHGGPGMPIMHYAHKFQKGLEKDFVVVQWDRRGAGKSYDENLAPETMNVEQLIEDTHELVLVLLTRFHSDKIYIVGHSWGTYLGMIVIDRYPELFHAYVGVGQLAYRGERNWEIQKRFIWERASETNNKEALVEIDRGGEDSYEKWLFEFGAELHNETSFWPFVWAGLQSSEYTFSDAFNVQKGSQLWQSNISYNALSGQLADEITSVRVPVYFFLGRYDYTTPFELAEEYFGRLSAPWKKMVWFENSAHFAFYEEPKRFSEEMQIVLRETHPLQAEK